MAAKVIQSAAFPGVYLRMDGTGLTKGEPGGGGVVNCQFGTGPLMEFEVEHVLSLFVLIRSVQFPKVYLRFDSQGVTGPSGAGGGVVNCQYSDGPPGVLEQFTLIPQGGAVAIKSWGPPVVLRMDGTGITQPLPTGGGIVNLQAASGMGPFERFIISDAPSS